MNNLMTRLKEADKTERSGIINLLIKPVSLVLTLAYIPILLDFLGHERYGLWTTLLSFISWINYFDAGIGQGLRNVLTRDLETQNLKHAQTAVSTAYIALSAISAGILAGLLLLTFTLDWNRVFSTAVNLRPTLLVTFSFLCLNFVLSLANTLLYALQSAEGVSVRGCFVQALNIAGVLALRAFSAGSLVDMAVLFGASSSVVNLAAAVRIMKKHPCLRPRREMFSRGCVSEICNTGMRFFVIQLMGLLMFAADDIIIAHFWGAEAVTPFSVVNRVFSTGYSVFAAFLVPYWSGTTAAAARGDAAWIRRSIKKIAALLAVFALGCIAAAAVFKPVMLIWLGQSLDYQRGIVPLMCVFYMLYAVLGVECYFINGSGYITVQMIVYLVVGCLNVPLSVLLGVGCGLETVGVRLATAVLLVFADIVLGFNLGSILRRIESGGQRS